MYLSVRSYVKRLRREFPFDAIFAAWAYPDAVAAAYLAREFNIPLVTEVLGSDINELVRYPMLAGTIRDHVTKERRPFLRFFACGEDITLTPLDTRLPDRVISGEEPLLVIGAVAGG